MDDDLGGAWAPIKQAAEQLGVSVDTVRRRIQRGELAARREETPQGYRWLVRVDRTEEIGADVADDNAPGSPRTSAIAPHDSGQGVIMRDAVIDALRAELDHRAREIAELHAIIGTQARALESVTALAALPERSTATADPGATEVTAPEAIGKVESEPAPLTFWARVRRALGG